MELQVSYSVCTEVSSESVFRRKTLGDTIDIAYIVSMERCGNNRGRGMPRPYVDTVGKNTKAIKEYIGDQLKRDHESDQLSMYDPKDPFTGSK